MQQTLSWLRKAAKLGNGDAYAQIGYFYTLGEGVEKNDSLAFENYKKSR
ncbi:sel1 repeat family protein [Bacteroides thetaiotaomicron]|nr:sel1 repeat family protein [Bacteroides thetaiotaomicron]